MPKKKGNSKKTGHAMLTAQVPAALLEMLKDHVAKNDDTVSQFIRRLITDVLSGDIKNQETLEIAKKIGSEGKSQELSKTLSVINDAIAKYQELTMTVAKSRYSRHKTSKKRVDTSKNSGSVTSPTTEKV